MAAFQGCLQGRSSKLCLKDEIEVEVIILGERGFQSEIVLGKKEFKKELDAYRFAYQLNMNSLHIPLTYQVIDAGTECAPCLLCYPS